MVDYGWTDPSVNLYSIKDKVTNTDLELSTFKKFVYDDFIKDYQGLVDVVVGRVNSYTSKVNAQGSFECSIELTSENTTLLDFEVTDENKLKFIFTNKIEMAIIKLLGGSKEDVKSIFSGNVFSAEDKKEVLDNFYNEIEISGEISPDAEISEEESLIPNLSVQTGLYYQNIVGTSSTTSENKEVLYISYGLFEDFFLNIYIAENKDSSDALNINFNSSLSKVRYDDNLEQRQKASFFSEDENLPLFLYPKNWGIEGNYNKKY